MKLPAQLPRLLLAAVLCSATALAVSAAEPSSDTLSDQREEVTWNGGPFVVSNPATTAGLIKQVPCDLGEPGCDQFRLTVGAGAVKQVLIAIAPGPPWMSGRPPPECVCTVMAESTQADHTTS